MVLFIYYVSLTFESVDDFFFPGKKSFSLPSLLLPRKLVLKSKISHSLKRNAPVMNGN